MQRKKEKDDAFDLLLTLCRDGIIKDVKKTKTAACIDDKMMRLYLDKDLSPKEMEKIREHILGCPYCSFKIRDIIKERKIERVTDTEAPLNIEFFHSGISVLSEPFSVYPAGVIPVMVRGGKRIYKRKSITRIWRLAGTEVRITFEKKRGKVDFLIRVLERKKPVPNEKVQIGKTLKATDRQGKAEFEIPLGKKRSYIFLKIPRLGRKIKIGLKNKKITQTR